MHTSFITLNKGLNDEISNYMVQALIQPCTSNMHYYPCYFFQNSIMKLKPTQDTTMQRSAAGVTASSEGYSTHKIYVPINQYNSNWLIVRVYPSDKTIKICVSLGSIESN